MSFPQQYIKRKAITQTVTVQKPKSEKKEEKQYRTANFLQDMRNIDKQIYDIVTDFGQRTKAFRLKDLWARYFVFLYLSGARRNEPFMLNPTITKFEKNGKPYYRIRRVNEKHFEGRNPRRVIINPPFKAWNQYEIALFEFLLNGNQETILDFRPLIDASNKHPERLKSFNIKYNYTTTTIQKDGKAYEKINGDPILRDIGSQITYRFSKLFRANMVDKLGNKLPNEGIVPHQIRHWRAYNLKIEKNIKDELVLRLIGWDNKYMLDYYSDIKHSIQENEAIAIYEDMEGASA